MKHIEYVRDKYAAVTGASSGIGRAYCQRLASEGWNLIIAARREERLKSLSEELTNKYDIEVDIIVADLGKSEDIHRLESCLKSCDTLGMLINNAGFMNRGLFHELDIDSELECIELNCQAVVRLTHAAMQGMLKRDSGIIINVSSLSALQPNINAATYNASKTFIVAFTQSLHRDYANTGLSFQAFCPDATATEAFDVAGIEPSEDLKSRWLQPDEAVDISLADLKCDELISITTTSSRNELIRKLIPAMFLRRLAAIIRKLARV